MDGHDVDGDRRSVVAVAGAFAIGTIAGCATVDPAGGDESSGGAASLTVDAGRSMSGPSPLEDFSTLEVAFESLALVQSDGRGLTVALGRTVDLTSVPLDASVDLGKSTAMPPGEYTAYRVRAPVATARKRDGGTVSLVTATPYEGWINGHPEPESVPDGGVAEFRVGFRLVESPAGTILDVDGGMAYGPAALAGPR